MSPIFLWACFAAGIVLFVLLFVQRMNDYEDLSDQIEGLRYHTKRHHEFQELSARSIDSLKEQVDHLAKVQMLILKDLGKEHRVEPARNVLVSIGDLSDLKKSKGRSA